MLAHDLASYIVNMGLESGRPVSNLQLQKIIYLTCVLYVRNKNLIDDINDNPFEAWQFGPVIDSIYNRFSYFDNSYIPIIQEYKEPEKVSVQSVYIKNSVLFLLNQDKRTLTNLISFSR